MRDTRRALALLVGMAWRTDRARTLGLLLEPLSFARAPLLAASLLLIADGAFRQDARLLALGGGGIAATQVAWFLGMWTGAAIRNRLIEEVGFALDREIALLSARLPGLEHHERAADAATQGKAERFLVERAKAIEEEQILRSVLRQLGWSLPEA